VALDSVKRKRLQLSADACGSPASRGQAIASGHPGSILTTLGATEGGEKLPQVLSSGDRTTGQHKVWVIPTESCWLGLVEWLIIEPCMASVSPEFKPQCCHKIKQN
jgi:hypothetical protein